MQYCCVMNACDTCHALRDLHFNLTISLYASSGHFPCFVNFISFSLRWTIYKAHVPWNAKGGLGVKEEKKVKSLCIIWHNMSIGKGMKHVT